MRVKSTCARKHIFGSGCRV